MTVEARTEGRPPHPRVPARGVRRRRGPRRIPDPGAGPAGRRRRLVLRRRPRSRNWSSPPTSPGSRSRPQARVSPADHVGRPADGGRRRGRRPGPQPHLVHQPGRPSGQAALRHPPRGDHPQPRAAPAVEGRAAGGRLCAVLVLRADRAGQPPTRSSPSRRARRRDILSAYPAIDPTGCTSSTTGSILTNTGPTRAPTWSKLRDRPGPALGDVRRTQSPRKRGSSTCWTPPAGSIPQPSSSSAPEPPDTPEIGGR